MDFDRYTVTLLIQRADAPDLSEEEEAALQDAHMSHVADLAEAGHLLAGGPLFDDVVRGLSILTVDPQRACELMEADPAVLAGVYTVWAVPWMVPVGTRGFSAAWLPRSMTEAGAR